MQGPIIIGEYVMSETEQDAHLGRAVKEHAEAVRTLESLLSDAEARGRVCESLARALKESTAEKKTNALETCLYLQKGQNFDWSKLTPESLSSLAAGLKAALRNREESAERERRLKGQLC